MKVLERTVTKNGIDIQIEDWSKNYSFHQFGDVVGLYPKATHTADNVLQYPRFNEKFRIEMHCKNNEEAKNVMEELKNGNKSIKEYSSLIINKELLEFI